jgi:hypothetical protein
VEVEVDMGVDGSWKFRPLCTHHLALLDPPPDPPGIRLNVWGCSGFSSVAHIAHEVQGGS